RLSVRPTMDWWRDIRAAALGAGSARDLLQVDVGTSDVFHPLECYDDDRAAARGVPGTERHACDGRDAGQRPAADDDRAHRTRRVGSADTAAETHRRTASISPYRPAHLTRRRSICSGRDDRRGDVSLKPHTS